MGGQRSDEIARTGLANALGALWASICDVVVYFGGFFGGFCMLYGILHDVLRFGMLARGNTHLLHLMHGLELKLHVALA